MSSSEAERQFTNILPPETGRVVAITTDSTSRSYDLFSIDFPQASTKQGDAYVTMVAETAAAYIAFGASAVTVSDTAAVSAGGTLAFTASAAFVLPVGVPMSFRLSRVTGSEHRYLGVKTASTGGVLRMYVSSPASP